jgi:hypothetical protein
MQFIYLFSKVKIEYYVFKLIGMEMISWNIYIWLWIFIFIF